jgi:H+/Cl- antiporter ClcA
LSICTSEKFLLQHVSKSRCRICLRFWHAHRGGYLRGRSPFYRWPHVRCAPPRVYRGIVSYQVSAALGIIYFYSPLQFLPVFSGFFLAQVIVAGIFFGIVALLLIELFNLFKMAAERLPLWAPAKGIIGGAALILLTLAFSTQYLGLGLETTQVTLQGSTPSGTPSP